MSLQTRGHRRLWLTSKVKVAVSKRFFLSFSTILFQSDHMCRVVHAFVEHLDMKKLGFERAQPEDTGRPGYDPRALLKLYLYGYLNQIRSSRRLEAECRRNVEVMWLLERLYPDHKTIAEFRRVHRDAVTSAGAELVRFAKSCGLIRGEWIAVDGYEKRDGSEKARYPKEGPGLIEAHSVQEIGGPRKRERAVQHCRTPASQARPMTNPTPTGEKPRTASSFKM